MTFARKTRLAVPSTVLFVLSLAGTATATPECDPWGCDPTPLSQTFEIEPTAGYANGAEELQIRLDEYGHEIITVIRADRDGGNLVMVKSGFRLGTDLGKCPETEPACLCPCPLRGCVLPCPWPPDVLIDLSDGARAELPPYPETLGLSHLTDEGIAGLLFEAGSPLAGMLFTVIEERALPAVADFRDIENTVGELLQHFPNW